MKRRPWFSWRAFRIQASPSAWVFKKWGNGRRGPFVYYHRLANGGRLQCFWFTFSWPLPWHAAVRDMPGYGVEFNGDVK